MVDFLAPVFAAVGVAAAAIPVVLHMLRRTPAQKLPFSLVRFLRPSLPKITRRSTIEHWPLLLLRMLALLLIGLAFARPFQRTAVSATTVQTAGDRVTVLLDASASMRRDGLREDLLRQLQEVIAALQPQDTLHITAFSRTSRTLLSAEEWQRAAPDARPALIDAATAAWTPDWMETRTGAALLNAAEELTRESVSAGPVGARRIVLLTDFQRGSQLDELRSAAWPPGVEVELRLLRPTAAGNAGITLAGDDASGQTRIRLTNSADAAQSTFTLQPFRSDGSPAGDSITAEVAPGQRRSIALPAQSDPAQPQIAGVELLQDVHPFDNVVDLPLTAPVILRVAHVGPDDVNNSELMRYYLQRAVDGNESEAVEVLDVMQADGVTQPVPEDVRLVVVTDTVPAGLLESLRGCLQRGGVLLVAVRTADVLQSVAALLPEPVQASEATVSDYAMLGQIDFSSPLFAAFAEARFADFSSIRFWHYRTLQIRSDSQVWQAPARFDSGAPAILEGAGPAGGRILLFAAGWHPDDSQWALSTRFPPLLTSLIRQAYPRRAGQLQRTVGDSLVPAELLGSDNWSIALPDETTLSAADVRPAAGASAAGAAAAAAAGATATPAAVLLEQPGRYTLTGRLPAGDRVLTLIVGLPAQETRTDPLPVGQLQALGLPAELPPDAVADSAAADSSDKLTADQLNSSELESRQKFWRWLLLAGLACLLLETLWAGRLERVRNAESVA